MKKQIKSLNDLKQKINNLITDLNNESLNSEMLSFGIQINYLQFASDSLQNAITWLTKYEKLDN